MHRFDIGLSTLNLPKGILFPHNFQMKAKNQELSPMQIPVVLLYRGGEMQTSLISASSLPY